MADIITPQGDLVSSGYPTTKSGILQEIAAIENMIKGLLFKGPAYFGANSGGSVQVNVPQYIQMLTQRKKDLEERLYNLPYWDGSDIEGVR